MSLDELTKSFPWHRYSRRLKSKIHNARSIGLFTEADSQARGMRYVSGRAGTLQEGNSIVLYWLVDPNDGVIIDVKFQALGQSALIGAAEICCELLPGKNYDQARRMTPLVVDKEARDQNGADGFPEETKGHITLVLEAIEEAAAQCTDISLPERKELPVPSEQRGGEGPGLYEGYPGWSELSTDDKLSVIGKVLDEDIRPYIAMDGGGVEVVRLTEENELIISYSGACTSCYSSVGATLSYIQQTLRANVDPSLRVIPDMDSVPA